MTSKRKRVAPQLVSDEEILERLRQSPYVPPKPRKKRPLPRMPTELPGPSSIWNVYDGPRALPRPLGIVNEKDRMRAEIAAMREWPDRPLIRVVRALDDPARRRELVRPAFLLPHVSSPWSH